VTWTIHNGDCLEVLRTLADRSVDAVVTDPPYGLAFMGKRWDYDVPTTDVWAECLRVLKPGGHLLAFGGTRTYHRLAWCSTRSPAADQPARLPSWNASTSSASNAKRNTARSHGHESARRNGRLWVN